MSHPPRPHHLTVPAPCNKCGSRNALSIDSKLQCRRCGDGRGQLGEQITGFIAAVEKNFGRIQEPIVYRRKSTLPREPSSALDAARPLPAPQQQKR
jgi:hypothetical protein